MKEFSVSTDSSKRLVIRLTRRTARKFLEDISVLRVGVSEITQKIRKKAWKEYNAS